jgi:hypothetical protein
MTTNATPLVRRLAGLATRIALDRRRHKRVAITLLGRFMREDKQEYPCRLIDISVGGVAVLSPVAVEPKERIVAYFDHIGGIEGTVARTFERGFAIELVATQHKREKLAAQLTWLLNRRDLGPGDRRHERVAPESEQSILTMPEGAMVPVRLLDVSVSGASVATDVRPEIGSEVTLGKLRAKVVRYHEQGFGVQFLDIQNPAALRRYFG